MVKSNHSYSGTARLGRARGVFVISAVLFALSAASGAYLARSAFTTKTYAMTADDVAEALDRYAATNPGAASVFKTLRTRYPKAHDALVRKVAEALQRGDIASIDRVAFQSTNALARAKAKHIAHASSGRLVAWGRSGLALMTVARAESPALCAQVAFGNVEPFGGAPSAALLGAVGRHATAAIEAFYDGESAPKSYPALTPAEQRTLSASAASQGIRQEDAPKLQSLAAIRALPEREQCDLAIKLMRGVTTAPEPARTRALSAMAAEAARTM